MSTYSTSKHRLCKNWRYSAVHAWGYAGVSSRSVSKVAMPVRPLDNSLGSFDTLSSVNLCGACLRNWMLMVDDVGHWSLSVSALPPQSPTPMCAHMAFMAATGRRVELFAIIS